MDNTTRESMHFNMCAITKCERYISDFWISQDNSETTISTTEESSAITNCVETCSASGTNSFSALRLTEFARYKCKCLDLSLSPVMIEVRELSVQR